MLFGTLNAECCEEAKKKCMQRMTNLIEKKIEHNNTNNGFGNLAIMFQYPCIRLQQLGIYIYKCERRAKKRNMEYEKIRTCKSIIHCNGRLKNFLQLKI